MSADHERLPVFVYGTLRPGQRNYGALLRGRTVGEEPARMRGAVLYEGPGYPYAVPDRTGEICGDLVFLAADRHDAVLASLDGLEGTAPGVATRHYMRVERPVLLADGRATRAWVYLAGEEMARRLRAVGTPIPGGSWPA
ncbi:gamma-glutamylcyclotransferase family protein [Streptomyces sp. ISL-11]|uniref:gamma-glutamylcyclotransferase family protein n=1 Tax=Streptomyces sp. ISL-11 TaxID=2819174 RepID=UPI001BE9F2CC|nr:gamma-glutamylcyclotransferase family protein [Streptomyces sp. ISL-11]MBT2387210.1 gamma-glutamylcyclotransferase [Streptomyces sp. ISL-11]